jgi:hypothetical protein
VAQGSGHDAHEAKVSLGALLAALPSYVPPLLKGAVCSLGSIQAPTYLGGVAKPQKPVTNASKRRARMMCTCDLRPGRGGRRSACCNA